MEAPSCRTVSDADAACDFHSSRSVLASSAAEAMAAAWAWAAAQIRSWHPSQPTPAHPTPSLISANAGAIIPNINIDIKNKISIYVNINVKMNIIIDRFGIVYGNSEFKSNCVVDYLINNFINKSVVKLRSPLAGRCFISVDDIAEALFHQSIRHYDNSSHKYPFIYKPCYNFRGKSLFL